MQLNQDALIEEALEAQKQMAMAVHNCAVPSWIELDLTMGQLKCLFLLAPDEVKTISDLAKLLGLSRPAASVMIDHLVDLGLIVRAEDPDDRRRTLVSLSPNGQDLYDRLNRGQRDGMREWLGRLNEDDLAALIRGMRALAEAISLDQVQLAESNL